jgi:hypothetical protein
MHSALRIEWLRDAMAMASCSLHENPFLTSTSGGNPVSASFAFFLALFSGSQLSISSIDFDFSEECLHTWKGPRSCEDCDDNGKGGWGAHLYEYKGVRLDGFEELTEYAVHERYEIFVRLVLRKRFFGRQG